MRLTHYTQMQNCQGESGLENPGWELESDQKPLGIPQSFATIGQAATVAKSRWPRTLSLGLKVDKSRHSLTRLKGVKCYRMVSPKTYPSRALLQPPSV